MRLVISALLAAVTFASAQDASKFRVKFDTTDAPEHEAWAQKAEPLGNEWFGRIVNLIGSPEHPAGEVVCTIAISSKYEGVAYAAGGKITISSKWVKDHPEDSRGVVVHELTHIVQGYPGGSEHWITEGISDYVRNAIFEARPLSWFPKPAKPQGYRDAYKVAAGFLLWLEAGPAPGIVRKLNSALRAGKYSPDIFKTATGKSLDDLWNDYAAPPKPVPLPAEPKTFNYTAGGGGSFVFRGEGKWVELKGTTEHATFKESARTAEHIEISDAARGISLRLTGNAVLMRRGRDWSQLYAGKWE